jgi:excisionase family DNA binding protein
MSYGKTFGGSMAKPLTVKEAAERLGYHPDHLRRLLRKGTVKGESFSGVWMIEPAEVERIKALQSEKGWLPKSIRKE